MPKMKTHRGTVKRFNVTGSGKIQRRKAYQNHRRRKSDKALGLIGKMITVAASDAERVRTGLGL